MPVIGKVTVHLEADGPGVQVDAEDGSAVDLFGSGHRASTGAGPERTAERPPLSAARWLTLKLSARMDEGRVVMVCPDCGAPLSSADLPCPFCAGLDEAPYELTHEYSKSFTTRWAFQPDTDGFVAELNGWLLSQPNLLAVDPQLHWAGTGIPRGATLTCLSGSVDRGWVFQFDRIKIRDRAGAAADLGSALNDWADRHPAARPVWRLTVDPAGVPVEAWILYAAPRESVTETAYTRPARRFLGVHRLPAAILLALSSLFALLGMAAGDDNVFVGCLAVAAISGVVVARYPVVTRRVGPARAPKSNARHRI